MTRRAVARPPILFRGWRVVAGGFLVLMAGYGAIYSYAAFADELAAAFAASRASVTLVFALAGGACFFVSALAGPLADRVGPRVPAAIGMLIVGLGLALAATATTLAEVCLSYGLLVGIGVGFAYVPAIAAVQRWFVASRGLASGLAAAGIGCGTALVPPAAEALSRLGDWRAGLLALGVLVALVGLIGALLLDSSPERHGLRPDGEDEASAARRASETPDPAMVEGVPLGMAWRTRRFGLLYAGTLLVSLPVALPFAHLARFAQDAGLSRHDAVALIGMIGVGSIAGRVVLGALADAIGRSATFLSCCAGLSIATLLWAVTEPSALAVFAFAFGVFYGGFVALLPAFTVDLFGRRSAAGVIGLLYTSRGLALLLGPPGVAFAASVTDDLTRPIATVAALGGVGAILLARATTCSPACIGLPALLPRCGAADAR